MNPALPRWWLRGSVAFLWIATGVLVLHPGYRSVGEHYLARLGLGAWPMWGACAAEVLLGLWVLQRGSAGWAGRLQLVLVLSFTTVLGAMDPWLLVHPFGMLSKNVPFLLLVRCASRVETEGLTRATYRLLRWGMASVWMIEGLFPKVLFQQPLELAVVQASGLVPFSASHFLYALGALQLLSGLGALWLRGRWVRALWLAQALALVVLPVLVTWHDPSWWVHPFLPMLKNVPILGGTLLLWRYYDDLGVD